MIKTLCKKSVEIFISLVENKSISFNMRVYHNTTYANLLKVLRIFEEANLIKLEKKNERRIVLILFTKKGLKLREYLYKLKQLFL